MTDLIIQITNSKGRHLDGLVALLIKGWQWAEVPPDINGENECSILTPTGELPEDIQLPGKGSIHPAYLVPAYSTRLDLAIELCKSMGRSRIEIHGKIQDLPKRLVRECLLQAVSDNSFKIDLDSIRLN